MEEFKSSEGMPASYEDDIRPVESPYAGPTVTIYFQTGDAFHIPRTIWSRCPELAAKRQQVIERKADIFGRPGQLGDIPIDVGHVLVNYLFTGNYECLRPNDAIYKDKISSELRTAVQVACAAKVYNLPGLGHLVNSEIKRLGDELDILHLIEIVEETNQPPVHLPGVSDYLQSRLHSLCDNLTASVADEHLEGLKTPTKISQILLKSIILFQSRGLDRSRDKTQQNGTGHLAGASEDTASENGPPEQVTELFSGPINRSPITKKEMEEDVSVSDAETAAEDECLAEMRDADDSVNESFFQCDKALIDENSARVEASAETIAIEETASEIAESLADEAELMALRRKQFTTGGLALKDWTRFYVDPKSAYQDEESTLNNFCFEEPASPTDEFSAVYPSIAHDSGCEDMYPTRTVYGSWKT